MADSILKWCYRCATHKPPSEFRPRQRRCYACMKEIANERYAQNAEYREQVKARNRLWGAANKERKSARDKAYNQANKEKIAAYKRAYKLKNWDAVTAKQNLCRQRNPEKYREREAAYREKNRAACNERIRAWKALNPDATVFYFHKRRAALIRALPAWADLDAIAMVFKKAQELGPDYHVDHIVPLISERVCGLHCEANLQVLPAKENMRKNNRRWPDMWE